MPSVRRLAPLPVVIPGLLELELPLTLVSFRLLLPLVLELPPPVTASFTALIVLPIGSLQKPMSKSYPAVVASLGQAHNSFRPRSARRLQQSLTDSLIPLLGQWPKRLRPSYWAHLRREEYYEPRLYW